jgi:hypothetical protein
MRPLLLLSLLTLALSLAAQPTRDELLSEPRYVEQDLRPTYRTLTAGDFQKSIAVKPVVLDDYGTRVHALEISIPQGHNALHAIAVSSIPKLLDSKGATVDPDAFRMDADPDSGALRLRYETETDGRSRVASVEGKLRLRYPLKVATRSIKASEKDSWDKHGIRIDGPFVYFDPARITSARWLSEYRLIRAYDASGRRLESAGEWVNENGEMFVAVYGNVARVDVDVPGEMAAGVIDYVFTPRKPPAAVKFRAIPSVPLSVLGDTVSYTEEQLRSYLAELTGTDEEQLAAGAAQGDLQAVRYLIALGADVNAGGRGGSTPFVTAAMLSHEEVAELLMEAGADVSTADKNGITPLMQIMSACPSSAFVQKMIDRGANVNAKAASGVTALALATAVDCKPVVATLKKAGAK